MCSSEVWVCGFLFLRIDSTTDGTADTSMSLSEFHMNFYSAKGFMYLSCLQTEVLHD